MKAAKGSSYMNDSNSQFQLLQLESLKTEDWAFPIDDFKGTGTFNKISNNNKTKIVPDECFQEINQLTAREGLNEKVIDDIVEESRR